MLKVKTVITLVDVCCSPDGLSQSQPAINGNFVNPGKFIIKNQSLHRYLTYEQVSFSMPTFTFMLPKSLV